MVGLFLVSQGVIQSLTAGPVASQEVIKELGTNGGGFFNVNSAHPFENPTWLSNFVELLLILAIPAALTSVYGRMVGNRRQGWAIYAAMLSLFVVAVVAVAIAENNSTPAMDAAGVAGFNMEGKEQRFGIASTALWVVATTAASCGAVNGAMESLTALGGAVPMAEMQSGEVIFGGVGSGLYAMLMFAILGVFLSGLMVGRTPEFLGKKIEAREIKLTVFGTIGVPMLVLVTSALADRHDVRPGLDLRIWAHRAGPRRSTPTRRRRTTTARRSPAKRETLTWSSACARRPRDARRALPAAARRARDRRRAGRQTRRPGWRRHVRTDSPTFVVVLVGVVVIVALLTFVPALLLGPIVQGFTDQLF